MQDLHFINIAIFKPKTSLYDVVSKENRPKEYWENGYIAIYNPKIFYGKNPFLQGDDPVGLNLTNLMDVYKGYQTFNFMTHRNVNDFKNTFFGKLIEKTKIVGSKIGNHVLIYLIDDEISYEELMSDIKIHFVRISQDNQAHLKQLYAS